MRARVVAWWTPCVSEVECRSVVFPVLESAIGPNDRGQIGLERQGGSGGDRSRVPGLCFLSGRARCCGVELGLYLVDPYQFPKMRQVDGVILEGSSVERDAGLSVPFGQFQKPSLHLNDVVFGDLPSERKGKGVGERLVRDGNQVSSGSLPSRAGGVAVERIVGEVVVDVGQVMLEPERQTLAVGADGGISAIGTKDPLVDRAVEALDLASAFGMPDGAVDEGDFEPSQNLFDRVIDESAAVVGKQRAWQAEALDEGMKAREKEVGGLRRPHDGGQPPSCRVIKEIEDNALCLGDSGTEVLPVDEDALHALLLCEASELPLHGRRSAGELESHPVQDAPQGAGVDFELRMNSATPPSTSDELGNGSQRIVVVLDHGEVEQGLGEDPGTLKRLPLLVLEGFDAPLFVACTPTVERSGRRAAAPIIGGDERLGGNNFYRIGLLIPLGKVVVDEGHRAQPGERSLGERTFRHRHQASYRALRRRRGGSP